MTYYGNHDTKEGGRAMAMYYLFGWRKEGEQTGGLGDLLARCASAEECMEHFAMQYPDHEVGQITGSEFHGEVAEWQYQVWVDNDSPRLWKEWRRWDDERREFVREHGPDIED